MTSRNFSSKGLLGDSLRRNLWGFVLGGVGFFLSLLLPLLMTMQHALQTRAMNMRNFPQSVDFDWQQSLDQVRILLGGGNWIAKAVLVVMAVVCGVVMFAYLHSRQKVDFYHSLPISRTQLFANNFVTGIILSLSIYLVVLALSIAVVCGMGFGAAVDMASIGSAVVSQIILFLAIYALTVLTTIVCGNTVITLLLLAWVHLSPMLMRILFVGLCERFYSTYAMENEHIRQAFYLSPLAEMFEINGFERGGKGMASLLATQTQTSAVGQLVAYLVVTIAATALALFLFRIRRSERAGMALAFPRAKLPIKVYMCLFMGIAFGIIFGLIAGEFWFWVGLVIGAVLFHWVVEIIYAFDFRAIFAKPLHLLVILVVLFAGMLCMKFDVTGYDSWLPDRDEIQAVAVNGDASELLADADNIEAAYQLGEIGVQVNQEAMRAQGDYYGVSLRFKLGGRTAIRYFLLPNDDEVNALLDQIYDSEEYKRVYWPLFQIDLNAQDRTNELYVYTNASGYSMAGTITNNDVVRQIITTLREESLERKENSMPVLRLSIESYGSDGEYYHQGEAYVTAEDEKTLALIEQVSGIKPAALSAENVDAINLQYSEQYGDSNDSYVETVQVTDRADIAALLQHACDWDAMGLGSLSDIRSQGFRVDARMNYMQIYARINNPQDQNGEYWFTLVYPDGEWPEAIVEKYRPSGDKTVASTMAAGQNTVATGTVG